MNQRMVRVHASWFARDLARFDEDIPSGSILTAELRSGTIRVGWSESESGETVVTVHELDDIVAACGLPRTDTRAIRAVTIRRADVVVLRFQVGMTEVLPPEAEPPLLGTLGADRFEATGAPVTQPAPPTQRPTRRARRTHAAGDLAAKRRRTIDTLESRLDQLPVLPAVVSKIAKANPNSTAFSVLVGELVRTDPPLAARLLTVANSALVGGASPIVSLPEALARVGSKHAAELITSLGVMRVFVPNSDGKRNLWIHSIQVAIAARRIAEAAPQHGIKPEVAYVAGLLHDIGRFVMFDTSPDDLGAVDEASAETPQALVEAELAICGFDHAELGHLASEKWGLPELVSELIRDHHKYEEGDPKKQIPEVRRLVKIVQQADFVSFFLIRHPELLAKPQPVRRLVLAHHCNHSGWGEPPVPTDVIEEQIDVIDASSRRSATILDLVSE